MRASRHVNHTLKPATIDYAKPREQTSALTVDGGLQLQVLPSGSKTWRFIKYHLNVKREKVAIGAHPTFTNKPAHDRHEGLCLLVERAHLNAKQLGSLWCELDDPGRSRREDRSDQAADVDDDAGKSELPRSKWTEFDFDAAQWDTAAERILQTSPRREAFRFMSSMPAGANPEIVRRAAREFGQAELANHRYVLVLHNHRAKAHVHLSVCAAGRDGRRLNACKEDLHRWREASAEWLTDRGIEVGAATPGVSRRTLRGWERQPGGSSRPRQVRRTQIEPGVPGYALGRKAGMVRDRQGTDGTARPGRAQAEQEHRLLRHADRGRGKCIDTATRSGRPSCGASPWSRRDQHCRRDRSRIAGRN